MDTYRAILAIALSFIVLIGYQYLFLDKQQLEEPAPAETQVETSRTTEAVPQTLAVAALPVESVTAPTAEQLLPVPVGREITVKTALYTATLSESGGGIKNFQLNDYRESIEAGSAPKELILTDTPRELPLFFSWGLEPDRAEIPLYAADRERLTATDQPAELRMTATLASGLQITRTQVFDNKAYLMRLSFEVFNNTDQPLQGAPFLKLTNRPFSGQESSRYLFNGPALLLDGALEEVKDLDKGARSFEGHVSWVAYEGNYFMCGIIPDQQDKSTVKLAADGDKVSTLLGNAEEIIEPRSSRAYNYTIYFGPKKLDILKSVGLEMERIINFGWFDKLARPALFLLNFFHRYVGNYGIAIILVTILFKMLFWPISHRGMKSMKNMQAIQPKMAKLREKYKNDPTRLNQEMMNLYKAYKVNPLGGCLPMLLQIPVFFALYKVLLQSIELRHAPFFLWINDLSAPDRLMLGFDLPFLGGIPVLTLLMGGSMFLQQKMSPAPADPTQAKIMMFLPVIFTFLFLNFASGLVLYWFVNNLLAILQQYIINRPAATTAVAKQ